jgi:hypothetical protein
MCGWIARAIREETTMLSKTAQALFVFGLVIILDAVGLSAQRPGSVFDLPLNAPVAGSRAPRFEHAVATSASRGAGGSQAATRKSSRKAWWLTAAATAGAITTIAVLAPGEAPIPSTPGRTSGGCTSFQRWGTLQTVSGYTCR